MIEERGRANGVREVVRIESRCRFRNAVRAGRGLSDPLRVLVLVYTSRLLRVFLTQPHTEGLILSLSQILSAPQGQLT